MKLVTLLAVTLLALLAFGMPGRAEEEAEADGADWWDRFVSAVSQKLHEGADYIKERAGPVIREKFDSAKATLQDPETHAKIQTWVREKVVPVVEEKWEQAKQFVSDEIAPEAKKIYEAAVTAHERLESEKQN